MRIRAFWQLHGTTEVDIPDGVDSVDVLDAVYDAFGQMTADECQRDAGGYEIGDWEEVESHD